MHQGTPDKSDAFVVEEVGSGAATRQRPVPSGSGGAAARQTFKVLAGQPCT